MKKTPVIFTSRDLKITQEETLFSGFFKMMKYQFQHRLFNGGWSEVIEREMFERGEASAVVVYDPNADSVVLVEQIRVGALHSDAPWQLEIIAGMNDGDDPKQVVIKEAKEEAGLDISNVKLIREFYSSSGGCSEKLSVFIAQADSSNAQGIYGLEDENEDIKVHVLTRQDAYQLVESGVIENAATIIGLQWLEMNHVELIKAWNCSL